MLFSWIVFLIIVTPLDLTNKVTDYGYLIIFQTLKKELVGFNYKRGNCKLPKWGKKIGKKDACIIHVRSLLANLMTNIFVFCWS